MNIAFYIDEMNLRGVANSTYQYAYYNKKILKNNSIIFYNKKNFRNNKKVILKFKKTFNVLGVNYFKDIDNYKAKFNINFIYTQKSGEKDKWVSDKIKTLVHFVYPQKLSEIHGYKYICVSNWLSNKFFNNKIPYLPYIVDINKTKSDLKKKLKIKKKQIVFGCHGGESSFDLKFTHDALIDIVNRRKDIIFIFLNIKKFCTHPQIIFIKGSLDEIYKRKFINTCDAMIYGRSLGESFGLSCGEFALLSKRIILYKFNRHRSHIQSLPQKMVYEYSTKKSLTNIIERFDKKKKIKYVKTENKYLNCTPLKMMKKFKKIFLSKYKTPQINYSDKIKNFYSFIELGYYYIRHKFYQHYYKYIESRIYSKKNNL
tara:strand:- start:967 stop:2079 length:1113 start_codon:yes stop_codon:yes gene_type:complete